MIGLVVVCHEDMGPELVKAAEMIVGKVDAVATVSVKQESAPELLRDEVQAAIKKVDHKEGVILFTDMFGGTPSNLSFTFLEEGRVEVISGVNLPILIKAINLRQKSELSPLAQTLETFGKTTIKLASGILKGNKRN